MTMKPAHWSVAGAKAALSQVISQAATGPQVIEKRGTPVAVVVSFADFQQAAGDSGSLRGSRWQRFLTASATLRAQGGATLELPRRATRRDPFGRQR